MTARAPYGGLRDGKPSATPPSQVTDVAERLCRAVRQEIRSCAMFPDGWELCRPSLVDLDAEREVLAAMTCDQRPPDWLKSEHFFQLFHAALFVLWSKWLEDGQLFADEFDARVADTIAAIKRNRLGEPLVERAVVQVAYEWPCVLPIECAALRVVHAAAMRDVRRACQRLEALLSLDASRQGDIAGAAKSIAEALRRVDEAVHHVR